MSKELLFHLAFWFLFGGMLVVQVYFALRARLAGEQTATGRKTIGREGWGYTIVRAIRSILLIAFLGLYAINSAWLGLLAAPFPDWLRWIGAALGVASIALYTWSRSTLGKEWSSRLQTRQKHRLVTKGPYAWIRHPIYLTLMGFLASLALITANWLMVAIFGFSIVDLNLRIPKEEQMMMEDFGEEYKAYMQGTGKLLPKIWFKPGQGGKK